MLDISLIDGKQERTDEKHNTQTTRTKKKEKKTLPSGDKVMMIKVT